MPKWDWMYSSVVDIEILVMSQFTNETKCGKEKEAVNDEKQNSSVSEEDNLSSPEFSSRIVRSQDSRDTNPLSPLEDNRSFSDLMLRKFKKPFYNASQNFNYLIIAILSISSK